MYVSGLVKRDPMRTPSYVALPKNLKAKQRSFNIQNNDGKNFLWSIIVLFHPAQHKKICIQFRIYQTYEHETNISEVQYPADIKNMGTFEYQKNIRVNVYGYENKKV